MAGFSQGVPFAVDASGRFRDVASVPRGLACGCFCAACEGKVVAKKGEYMVHHFAHADLRECRHALEASIFGMIIALASEPGAHIDLPPCGDRRELVPVPDRVFTPKQTVEFFRSPWVIESRRVDLGQALIAKIGISQCDPNIPEFELHDLEVHLASFRKPLDRIKAHHRPSSRAVLVIDIRDYVRLWWAICEANKNEIATKAATATSTLRRWMQSPGEGRVWLFHPELEEKKRILREWIAKNRIVVAAHQASARVLAQPPMQATDSRILATGSEDGGDVAAFMRPLMDSTYLTVHLAAEMGLWRDTKTGGYVALGKAGATIPTYVEKLLRAGDWIPVRHSELASFESAKSLMEQMRRPYRSGGNH